MFCANFEKFIKVMVMIVSILFFLQLISCSGGVGGASDSDFDSGSARSVYSGDFNVNGGHYNTCTLEGNEQGGSITLSNGTKSNLLGTYGSSSRTAYKIEGYYIVSFNGVSTSYSYSIIVNTDIFAIMEVSDSGTEKFYAGGDKDSVPIVAGSAEDPFNGTLWVAVKEFATQHPEWISDSTNKFKFSNGTVDVYFLDDSVYTYQVLKTSKGFKVIWNIRDTKEKSIQETLLNYDYSFHYVQFIIDDVNSETGEWSERCSAKAKNSVQSVVLDNYPVMTFCFYRVK